MMKRGILLGVLLLLLIPTVVLAAAYSATITVTESKGSSYVQLPVSFFVNNTYLVSNNFITSTGLDTRVLESGVELPHMVVSDRTLFATNISANTQHLFSYTTGNSALADFPVIVGYGGYITVVDDALLELGSIFEIEQRGWVSASSGSGKDLLYKQNAFRLYVNAESSLRAAILGAADSEVVTVTTAVASGEHIVKVTSDGVNIKIFIDGVEKASTSMGANSVPNNANNWVVARNNSMPYMDYLKIQVG